MAQRSGMRWMVIGLVSVLICAGWYFAVRGCGNKDSRNAGKEARQGFEKSKELVKEGLGKTKDAAQEGLDKTKEAAKEFKKGWEEGGKK